MHPYQPYLTASLCRSYLTYLFLFEIAASGGGTPWTWDYGTSHAGRDAISRCLISRLVSRCDLPTGLRLHLGAESVNNRARMEQKIPRLLQPPVLVRLPRQPVHRKSAGNRGEGGAHVGNASAYPSFPHVGEPGFLRYVVVRTEYFGFLPLSRELQQPDVLRLHFVFTHPAEHNVTQRRRRLSTPHTPQDSSLRRFDSEQTLLSLSRHCRQCPMSNAGIMSHGARGVSHCPIACLLGRPLRVPLSHAPPLLVSPI